MGWDEMCLSGCRIGGCGLWVVGVGVGCFGVMGVWIVGGGEDKEEEDG